MLFPEYSELSCDLAGITLLEFQGRLDFVSVNHRDFLGAIMSLGLRREKLGDLLVTETGCALFVQQEVAAYIMQNELRVKHVPLTIVEKSLDTFEPPMQNTKELNIDFILFVAYNINVDRRV